MASGDDVVTFADPSVASPLRESILHLSSREKKPVVVGLGQCITQV